MPPVRRPAKRRASSCTTGVLPLVDNDADPLAFEGRLDLDFQRIMAVAPHVQRYVEQPETFRLLIEGRVRRYTPDGLAYTSFGRLYFEVKPERKLARSPDLDGKLASIVEECARRGAGFSIVTESDIRVGNLLSNSTAVWSAAQDSDPHEVQRACRLLRSVAFPATMRDIGLMFGPRRWSLAKALIGLRYLATDLSKPFSDDTVITRGGRDW
ncbi:TnsA endonuclease N-terminal domain-containing protein [Sphingobium sp. RSMS]|uniref:TnsA endonuclease N-terminal domain-containing protein n=1 Tax=Sphingobium sp. RSMS TaxID=520734 RepID=UPI0010F7AFE0|nr:TnsA endonuclease N-terminal domain-containing protein [Sphingobium sp. RSMS]UXC90282.1 TnsA endonuclease N-terminal domain-containing protein [Sphingobium sp. RSMS]